MLDRGKTGTTRLLAAAFTVALLSGCAQTKGWLDNIGGDSSSPSSANQDIILGAPSADEYLRDLGDIASGDPARQAEIFADGVPLMTKKLEERAAKVMKRPEYKIELRVGKGRGVGHYWTCDLGHEYVRINADYRT